MTVHAHLTFIRVSNRFSARLMVLICEYIHSLLFALSVFFPFFYGSLLSFLFFFLLTITLFIFHARHSALNGGHTVSSKTK